MSEVVTGDAVVLDVQIAQLPVRAVSAVIDITIIFIGYILGLMLWATALTQFDEALTTAFLIIFTVLALVGYPLVWETATRGRSVGKIVMGLRVVSDDGGPERFRQALFRALASVVEIWMLLGSPAVICSMLSPKAKRVGDVFAGTVVVSEHGPRLGPPPVMPPSLAWWASSLQLSGLTAGQATSQFDTDAGGGAGDHNGGLIVRFRKAHGVTNGSLGWPAQTSRFACRVLMCRFGIHFPWLRTSRRTC